MTIENCGHWWAKPLWIMTRCLPSALELPQFLLCQTKKSSFEENTIDLSKVPTAILQGVQKHWGERAATNGAYNIYYITPH